jgi:hypothetical protein
MHIPLWSWTLAALAFLASTGICRADEKLSYNRDIRPILSEHCFLCHGPDKNNRKAKLRLDERDVALARKALVPGKPDQSAMVERIFADDPAEVMPPPKLRKPLSLAQKQLLKRWIAEGAEYQPAWAYVTPVREPLPAVANKDWPRTPIDYFLLRKLEANKIAPSPETDRITLLRRLSLDLIGLPPSPDDAQAFLADTSPKAYYKAVERLLASKHYGERMAVPWLDIVRFADTVGYHGDQPQRIFPYRDYVINAFNRNLPFDQFTIEQLAGDLLPNPTAEQLVATGFNRLNMVTREGGAQPKEYLVRYTADRVRTLGMAWMGSTLGCAECHDHKFDPITTKDFYQLAAFFADVKQWGVYQDYAYTPNPDLKNWSNDHPFPPEILVDSPTLQNRMTDLRRKMEELAAATAQRSTDLPRWKKATQAFLAEHPEGWQPLPLPGNQEPSKNGFVLVQNKAQTTFEMPWKAEWLSTLKVEFEPHAALGETIGKATAGTIRLNATLRRQGKEIPLKFRQAEADLKAPIYRAGEEVPGILNGWRLGGNLKQRRSAYWLLEQPLETAEGDVLSIALKGLESGFVRVSASPLAGENPLVSLEAEAIGAALSEDRPAQRASDRLLDLAFLRGTAFDKDVYLQYVGLHNRWLECKGGKSWALITQSAAKPLAIRVLARGNWQDENGEIVQPLFPHFLPQGAAADRKLTRLDLARWLVSPENPLTARVVMNRLWKQFFGTGLSARLDDLGGQGEWPSHPELLDWLAVEFRESGWDVKHMVRLIVSSAAYRQSSNSRPELRDVDPDNRLLAHQNARRLEAEFIRDNALAAAGLLNLEYGGPSAWPYQPAHYYVSLQFPDRDYIADRDERQYRRGVYMHWQRTFLHPMLANFDAPTREDCIANRTVANTPQQALTLLNDPTFVEAARVLAARLLDQPKRGDADRLELAYRRCLSRAPRAEEIASLTAFLKRQREHFQANPKDAGKLVTVGIAPVPADADRVELAAWTCVCRAILNLHETITRY